MDVYEETGAEFQKAGYVYSVSQFLINKKTSR